MSIFHPDLWAIICAYAKENTMNDMKLRKMTSIQDIITKTLYLQELKMLCCVVNNNRIVALQEDGSIGIDHTTSLPIIQIFNLGEELYCLCTRSVLLHLHLTNQVTTTHLPNPSSNLEQDIVECSGLHSNCLVCGCLDGQVFVYSMSDHRVLRSFCGIQGDGIHTIVYDPLSANLLVTAMFHEVLNVWNLKDLRNPHHVFSYMVCCVYVQIIEPGGLACMIVVDAYRHGYIATLSLTTHKICPILYESDCIQLYVDQHTSTTKLIGVYENMTIGIYTLDGSCLQRLFECKDIPVTLHPLVDGRLLIKSREKIGFCRPASFDDSQKIEWRTQPQASGLVFTDGTTIRCIYKNRSDPNYIFELYT